MMMMMMRRRRRRSRIRMRMRRRRRRRRRRITSLPCGVGRVAVRVGLAEAPVAPTEHGPVAAPRRRLQGCHLVITAAAAPALPGGDGGRAAVDAAVHRVRVGAGAN